MEISKCGAVATRSSHGIVVTMGRVFVVLCYSVCLKGVIRLHFGGVLGLNGRFIPVPNVQYSGRYCLVV